MSLNQTKEFSYTPINLDNFSPNQLTLDAMKELERGEAECFFIVDGEEYSKEEFAKLNQKD